MQADLSNENGFLVGQHLHKHVLFVKVRPVCRVAALWKPGLLSCAPFCTRQK